VRTRFHDDEGVLVARTARFSPLLAAGTVFSFLTGRLFFHAVRDWLRLLAAHAGW
jgi:hypothetical protein